MYYSGKNNWDFNSSALYRILTFLIDTFRAWLFRMSWSRGNAPYTRRDVPPYQSTDTAQNRTEDPNSSYRYYQRKYPYQSYHGGYRPNSQNSPFSGSTETHNPSDSEKNSKAETPRQSVQEDGSYHYSYRKVHTQPETQEVKRKSSVDTKPQAKTKESGRHNKWIYSIPFLAALICIILYILFLPLRQWYDFVIMGMMALIVCLLIFCFLPRKKKGASEAAGKENIKSTGNREIDQMMKQGYHILDQMRQANVAIENEEISQQISQLEKTTEKIFEYVVEHPQKASQIRKFMNYYLPTTLKLLNTYDRLSDQEIEGENISSTMHNIEGIMHTIVLAFEKQLDHLFQDEAMDIATDITVLEGMLAQEGLLDEEKAKQKTSKK